MKTFDKLGREEIRELTEQDLERYKKIALAEEGVVPCEAPEEPVYFDVPEPDLTVYEAAGSYFYDIVQAENHIKTSLSLNYNYDAGSDYKYVVERESYNKSIEGQQVYSKELYKECSEKLKQNKKLKTAYSDQLKQYNAYIEEQRSITSYIDSIIHAVEMEDYFIDTAKTRFKELLELSENGAKIARNFFLKAYPVEKTEDTLYTYMDLGQTHLEPLTYAAFYEAATGASFIIEEASEGV